MTYETVEAVHLAASRNEITMAEAVHHLAAIAERANAVVETKAKLAVTDIGLAVRFLVSQGFEEDAARKRIELDGLEAYANGIEQERKLEIARVVRIEAERKANTPEALRAEAQARIAAKAELDRDGKLADVLLEDHGFSADDLSDMPLELRLSAAGLTAAEETSPTTGLKPEDAEFAFKEGIL